MPTLKPDAIIVNTLTALLKDAGNQFLVSARDTNMDSDCIVQRVEHEGQSFVTKTLPNLGKHFDAALSSGVFLPIGGSPTISTWVNQEGL